MSDIFDTSDHVFATLPTPAAIISLSGQAGAGKDTVAEHLVTHYGAVQLAFADKLRDSLLALDPIIAASADGPYAAEPVRLSHHIATYGWEQTKDSIVEVRQLMQRLGTEAGRKIHGDHLWLDALTATFRDVCRTSPGAPVVISDARFPHEVSHSAWLGGITEKQPPTRHVWIDRPGHARVTGRAAAHASENALGPDHPLITDILVNDGSPQELGLRVDALCADLGLPSTLRSTADM